MANKNVALDIFCLRPLFQALYLFIKPLKYTLGAQGETPIIAITGIPRFTMLMWGHIKKTTEAKTV